MKTNSVATLIFIVILVVGGIFAFATANASYVGSIGIGVVTFSMAIVASSSTKVAEKFGEAAKTYINNPVALHLRAMNMLCEGLKQNSAIVVVPSSALETMQLGGLAGIAALTMGWNRKTVIK